MRVKRTEKQKARELAQKLKRKTEKEAKRKHKQELEDKWHSVVQELFIRDKNCCVFCGKEVASTKHYQPMHILPWEVAELRYDTKNLLLGCFYCHKVSKLSMHMNPLYVSYWLQKNRPEQYNYLVKFIIEHYFTVATELKTAPITEEITKKDTIAGENNDLVQ